MWLENLDLDLDLDLGLGSGASISRPQPILTDLILDTWMKEKRIRAEPFNRGRGIHQGLDLQRLMDAAANV